MAHKQDWLPSTRNGQLAMAQNWYHALSEHAQDWEIPTAVTSEFAALTAEANQIMMEANTSERTTTMTAQVIETFGKLIASMRNMKKRYFFVPPLETPHITMLGLNPPDEVKTPIPRPTGTARGTCLLTVAHHLTVTWEIENPSSDGRSDHGVRIHYGVVVDDPAEQSNLTGKQYYMNAQPHGPELLKEDTFTRRRRFPIAFPYEDSGKTAWFCLRIENGKGEAGNWGTMFSAIIP